MVLGVEGRMLDERPSRKPRALAMPNTEGH